MVYYKSVSAIAGGGKTAVLLNTFSKGLARCSGSNWVFFPDPNWLCAPGANIYAHTREECEEKLKVLIVEMKAEIAEAQRLMDLGEGDGRPLKR